MAALTFVPGALWIHPLNDATYSGFDPKLVYASPLHESNAESHVRTSQSSADFSASAFSEPAINILTTSMRRFHVALDVVIAKQADAPEPLRLGIWTPWNGIGYFVVFGPAPSNLITADLITQGESATTLLGGEMSLQTILGRYVVGDTYHVEMTVDKDRGLIVSRISKGPTDLAAAEVSASIVPLMFSSVQLALSASVVAGLRDCHVILSGYKLALPHESLWANKAQDFKAYFCIVGLALIGVCLIALQGYAWFRTRPSFKHQIALLVETLAAARPVVSWSHIAILAAIFVYFFGNGLLLHRFGGHPFDMAHEQLYAYIARAHGPAELYYQPNLISTPAVWDGVPYIEAAFPYEPVMAYLSVGIGWLYSILFAAGASFDPGAYSLEHLIKVINVLFGLGDAALIYLIAQGFQLTRRWSLVASGLFMFNPAVWFSMSVWGQTHVISIVFVLATILFAQRRLPFWAWLALSAACLTRPQMVVFGLLLGIALLKTFTLRENLAAISSTVIITFIAILPMTLATSPSLPIDIMLNNFHVQQGGGNERTLTTVSQDAYSIWPLVTYFARGASGLGRAFTPSADRLIGPLSYQIASQAFTAIALSLTSSTLALRKSSEIRAGHYMPLAAVGVMSFLMLFTGILATYFLLALPMILLTRRWTDNLAYFFSVAVWTISTLVPMFGDMGIALTAASQANAPLAPENSPLTQFFINLYASDRFITVAVVGNVCAVVLLAVSAFRQHNLSPRAA